MFASWSAGEFGNVGATEWLEVRTTTSDVEKKKISPVPHVLNVSLFSGLFVLC